MSRALTIREAMVEAARRERAAPSKPEKYRWIAVWWRLHARESRVPEQSRRYAQAQMMLAADMEARPSHYAAKPSDRTDWQHSGLARSTLTAPGEGEARNG